MVIIVTKTTSWISKPKYDVRIISVNEDSARAIESETLSFDDAVKKINLLPNAHVISYCKEIKNRAAADESGATGKNTRIIDSAVQLLFKSGGIEFDDFFAIFYKSADLALKTSMFNKLTRRLKNEHSFKFSRMIVDFENRRITIKTLR